MQSSLLKRRLCVIPILVVTSLHLKEPDSIPCNRIPIVKVSKNFLTNQAKEGFPQYVAHVKAVVWLFRLKLSLVSVCEPSLSVEMNLVQEHVLLFVITYFSNFLLLSINKHVKETPLFPQYGSLTSQSCLLSGIEGTQLQRGQKNDLFVKSFFK